MKTETVLQGAAVVAAGVVAYLLVTRTMAAGGKLAEGAKKVLTEDLNPASNKNVVYSAASAITNAVAADGQDKPLGVRIWEKLNPNAVAQETAIMGGGTADVSNTAKQIAAYAQGGPSMGVYAQPSPDQSDAETARLARQNSKVAGSQWAANLFDMYYSGANYNQEYWPNWKQ